MKTFLDTYVSGERMFVRIGTCHAYPQNDATSSAVRQLEYAYRKLSEPNCTFENGRTAHECANEIVERYEDTLLDYLCVLSGGAA